MNVFIPHHSPLKERRSAILSTCKNLNPILITAFDRESLPPHYLMQSMNEYHWDRYIKKIIHILLTNANMQIKRTGIPSWLKQRQLKPAEISLTYKHFIALSCIYASKEPGLVFEDDTLSHENSQLMIGQSLSFIKQGYDFVDLGGGCNLPSFASDTVINNFKSFVHTQPPRSRTTAAFAISPEAALLLSKDLFPLVLPLDWSFQYLFIKHSFNVAWSNPPALIHGSQYNTDSSIQ